MHGLFWTTTLLTLLVTALPAHAAEGGCKLSPDQDHVELKLPDVPATAPDLRFYGDKSLKGTPVMTLDKKGLSFQGRVLCDWSGGSYNAQKSVNMVLTCNFKNQPGAIACARGLPVKSFWSDDGEGSAVLFLEVKKLEKGMAELEFQQQALFLNVGALDAETWKLVEAPNKATQRKKERRRALVTNKKFLKFTTDMNQCLASEDRTCANSLIAGKDRFYVPELQSLAAGSTGNCRTDKGGFLSQRRFSECLQEAPFVDLLKECFSLEGVEALQVVDENTLRLDGGEHWCELVREDDEWTLETITPKD
ncbi:MAG: hypothetical protein AB2A00_20775 [Myxococcota bacterium]